jgi:hypothetical protein
VNARHALVFGPVFEQPGSLSDDASFVGADQLDRARPNRLGPLGLLA